MHSTQIQTELLDLEGCFTVCIFSWTNTCARFILLEQTFAENSLSVIVFDPLSGLAIGVSTCTELLFKLCFIYISIILLSEESLPRASCKK